MVHYQTKPVPQFKRLLYAYNPESGLYVCNDVEVLKEPLNAITGELHKEPATNDFGSKIKPPHRLRSSRYKKGVHGFFTNLYPTAFAGWFVGCHFRLVNNKETMNTIIVKPAIKPKAIELYYFLSYDDLGLYDRVAFANHIIPQLRNDEGF